MLKVLKNFIVLFVIVCSGCTLYTPDSPHIALSTENKAKIKSISLSQADKKGKMFVNSRSGNSASMVLGGVIGLGINIAIHERDANNIENYAQENKIDISQIIDEQIKIQFKEELPYKIDDKTQDIKLNTWILMYGLNTSLLSSNYVPYIKLHCQLVKGNQVLMNVILETQLEDGYLKDDLLKDPNKLRMMWNKAAQNVVAQLVENLK